MVSACITLLFPVSVPLQWTIISITIIDIFKIRFYEERFKQQNIFFMNSYIFIVIARYFNYFHHSHSHLTFSSPRAPPPPSPPLLVTQMQCFLPSTSVTRMGALMGKSTTKSNSEGLTQFPEVAQEKRKSHCLMILAKNFQEFSPRWERSIWVH